MARSACCRALLSRTVRTTWFTFQRADLETEAQREHGACPRSHSRLQTRSELGSGALIGAPVGALCGLQIRGGASLDHSTVAVNLWYSDLTYKTCKGRVHCRGVATHLPSQYPEA